MTPHLLWPRHDPVVRLVLRQGFGLGCGNLRAACIVIAAAYDNTTRGSWTTWMVSRSTSTASPRAHADAIWWRRCVVPRGTLTVRKRTFQGYRLLVSCGLPPGLTKIGDRAFKGCEHLRRINLPRTLKYIGIEAFSGCVVLDDIDVPDLAFIGRACFANCRHLRNVVFTCKVWQWLCCCGPEALFLMFRGVGRIVGVRVRCVRGPRCPLCLARSFTTRVTAVRAPLCDSFARFTLRCPRWGLHTISLPIPLKASQIVTGVSSVVGGIDIGQLWFRARPGVGDRCRVRMTMGTFSDGVVVRVRRNSSGYFIYRVRYNDGTSVVVPQEDVLLATDTEPSLSNAQPLELIIGKESFLPRVEAPWVPEFSLQRYEVIYISEYPIPRDQRTPSRMRELRNITSSGTSVSTAFAARGP